MLTFPFEELVAGVELKSGLDKGKMTICVINRLSG